MTNWTDADGREIDEEDRGLVYDMTTLVNRRAALGLFGGVSVLTLLAACGMTSETTATPASTTPADTTPDGNLVEVPDETGGPFPADGSNGVNVLDDSGIVRSDIRSSFGSSTVVAAGVPLTVVLTVRDAATGDALSGGAVYLWHCDRDGGYSLYSDGLADVNYLRGVQEIGADGSVTFTTIFPGCYAGRWPHIHFEVYSDVATAVASGPIVKTSQIALPKEASDAVYATSGYEQSVRNLAGVTLASDGVFGEDGGIHQIATMTGSASAGYTAALTIGV
ncbi:MAG: 3,4-dioxygenase subunit beta [Pseudolysinimonas sp.]|uniref:3,4-dioxygenase subunit beta n=1 Tax=Pseudolysinimonas sp. TaxID=2680009 RepID=UPI003C744A25